MAETRKLRHQTGTAPEVDVVTVTVRDVELHVPWNAYGHPIDLVGTIPVIVVEHVGKPGQDLDEAKVAERIEAKVRKHPDDPARWTP